MHGPQAQQLAQVRRRRRLQAVLLCVAAGLLVVAFSRRPFRRLHRLGSAGTPRQTLESAEDPKPAGIEMQSGTANSGSGLHRVPLFRGAKREPTHYHLHLGVGSAFAGELHSILDGTLDDVHPKGWLLMYQRRWASTLRAWRPLATLRLMPTGCEGSLRWSRSLSGESPEQLCDGSGLEVHLESVLAGEWPSAQEPPSSLELVTGMTDPGSEKAPPRFKQSVELVVGPTAQARYLNVTLPVGVLFGASVDSQAVRTTAEGDSRGRQSEGQPFRVYAHFTVPGLNDLRGWLCELKADDSLVGQVQAQLLLPWARGSKTRWSVQHQRTHGAVSLPYMSMKRLAAAAAAVASSWDGRVRGPREGLCEAVIPTTLVKLSSDGRGAALSIDSSQAGLGGPGFGATVEATTAGWGVQLGLAGGNSQRGWGQPHYSITAQAPWGGNTSVVAHEMKWMFQDGQGFWVTVRDSGSGPRVNAGLEIR